MSVIPGIGGVVSKTFIARTLLVSSAIVPMLPMGASLSSEYFTSTGGLTLISDGHGQMISGLACSTSAGNKAILFVGRGVEIGGEGRPSSSLTVPTIPGIGGGVSKTLTAGQ